MAEEEEEEEKEEEEGEIKLCLCHGSFPKIVLCAKATYPLQ
jgi:hypothetical protein